MPDRDAIRGRDDLKQIEASIRRLHYYGDPPDARLQQDVDGDVLDIMDRILAALATAEEERDKLRSQGFVDGRGTIWTVPNTWPLQAACETVADLRNRLLAAERRAKDAEARADAAEQERDKNAILAATLLAEMGRVRDPRMSDVATTLADLGRIISGPDSIGIYPKAGTLTAEQATQMLGEYRAALARAASGGTATRTGDPRPDGSREP